MKKYIASDNKLPRKQRFDINEFNNRIAKREARIDEFAQKVAVYDKLHEEFRSVIQAEFDSIIQPWQDKIPKGCELDTKIYLDSGRTPSYNTKATGHNLRIRISFTCYDIGGRNQLFGWKYQFDLYEHIDLPNSYEMSGHNNDCSWDELDILNNDHINVLKYSLEFIQFMNNFDWQAFMTDILDRSPKFADIIDIPNPYNDKEYADPNYDDTFIYSGLQQLVGKDLWIERDTSRPTFTKIISINFLDSKMLGKRVYVNAVDLILFRTSFIAEEKSIARKAELISMLEHNDFSYSSGYGVYELKNTNHELSYFGAPNYHLPYYVITQVELIEMIKQL